MAAPGLIKRVDSGCVRTGELLWYHAHTVSQYHWVTGWSDLDLCERLWGGKGNEHHRGRCSGGEVEMFRGKGKGERRKEWERYPTREFH